MIAFLEAVFRTKLTTQERDAYYLLLKDEDTRMVMARAIAYCKGPAARFGFPKPGDLIEQENFAGRAVLACGAAMKSKNSWATTEFEDPLIAITIEEMGGWERWCSAADEETGHMRREFERIYVENAKRPLPQEIPGLYGSVSGDRRFIPCPYLREDAKPPSLSSPPARPALEE